MLHDDLLPARVVPEREAAHLVNVSAMTWQRMRARGETPPHIQLSPRRIGYRLVDLIKWLEDRRSA